MHSSPSLYLRWPPPRGLPFFSLSISLSITHFLTFSLNLLHSFPSNSALLFTHSQLSCYLRLYNTSPDVDAHGGVALICSYLLFSLSLPAHCQALCPWYMADRQTDRHRGWKKLKDLCPVLSSPVNIVLIHCLSTDRLNDCMGVNVTQLSNPRLFSSIWLWKIASPYTVELTVCLALTDWQFKPCLALAVAI